MLSLAAPWWLTGWLLLPVIRWLHRGGRHRRVLAVARLGLWRSAPANPAAQGRRQPPDPAWRRRALLAALLLAALAAPQWPAQRQRVTLWVDDSPSLLTREAQGTRLALGLAQARGLLAALPGTEVELRALGNPWQALPALDDGTAAALAATAGLHEAAAPPAALLARDRQHWLLTDGVDASLLSWPGGARPDRVLTVGGTQRNAGLRRLAARRAAADGGRLELSIEAVNGGTAPETRELRVAVDGGEPLRSALRLEPGATARVLLQLPAGSAARVQATLQPGDALAEDDTLVLDLAPLRRRRVADDPACPAALRSAVAAHPALALVAADAGDVQVTLECAPRAVAARTAVIGLQADRLSAAASGPLRWSAALPAARRIALDGAALRVAARLAVQPRDEVLLAVGAEPVVVARAAAPPRLDSVLDLDAMAAARGPDVPLLVNLMFEQVLGSRLLDGVASVERSARWSRVAPVAPAPAASAAEAAVRDVPAGAAAAPLQDGTRPLLLAALLVLLWELAALVRQGLRLRTPVEAGEP